MPKKLLTLVLVCLFLFLLTGTASAWYSTDWPYRKPLTIQASQVSGNLVDFAVLVDVTDADLTTRARSDGADILFTASDGTTKLDHEIESYDAVTGHLLAWVRVPSLSAVADTVIYMYYGHATVGSQENPQGVWDSHYVMVQHLDETSASHYDSTSQGNDGTPQNGLLQDAVGKIDGADEFEGVNQFIDAGTGASLDVFGPGQDFSIFAWVKRDTVNDVQGFFASGSTWERGIYLGSVHQSEDNVRFLSTDNTVDAQSTTGPLGDTDWHHVGVTADRDGNLDLWVDGVSVHTESIAAYSGQNWNRLDDTYKIGTDRSENNPMDGILDEVRVSDIARSADWIATQYANVNDPGSFLAIGAEQHVDEPGISNESPAHGTRGVSVSLTELTFHLEDAQGDPLDYQVTTSPDIGSDSASGVGTGTYAVAVSGLAYATTYEWTVDVTDGTHSTIRTYTFTTEADLPVISNPAPADGAEHVPFNPTLSADVFDEQAESVDWEINVYLGGAWQPMDSGTLASGSGRISADTVGVEAYGTIYNWRVRVQESGGGPWVEETYSFQTLRNELRFAAFTDTHLGAEIETSWGMAEYLDLLAQDVMNNTPPCDFVVHLGDIVMHSTAYVEGESLPSQYNQYVNNLKAYLLQHVNVPFMAVSGNHDLNDYYGEDHAGYPHNSHDPFNLVRELIDTTEMNSYPYAFMRNNILFIALPETDYHHFTKPTIYEYVEYITRRYPDNTTIILSHQAIEDTTIHDGTGSSTYRGKQDRAWWAEFFRNNPQIKMWIHGHQHMLDWYQSDHSSGATYPVQDFGHEMAFSMPYSQADWGNYFEEDRMVIYSVSADGFATQAWENNGSGGHWVPDYDHQWQIPTTYDESAQDWYSFPIFIQDGEVQLTDMKVFSPKTTLELIGTQPMELFYDPTMATQGTSWGGENLLGFGDDLYAEATPTLPGMTVHGPADLDFPPKYSGNDFQGGGGAYHEDGRTGQPYHYFPVGTTHAAVPGATYAVTITARSASGTGALTLDMSVSDWGSGTQYSTLAGSSQQVLAHTFGLSYETVHGTYTVPNDPNAWFLQGYLNFGDATDYDVSLFSIKRLQDSPTTDDFGLSLNGTWYNHAGSLAQYERAEFILDPTTLADEDGVIEITSSIGGHHFGMARLIYHAPLLMGRNARFRVNSVSGNHYNLTLKEDLSYYSDTFKMFPFSGKYGSFTVTSDDGSAEKKASANGNEWLESNTPSGTTEVTLDIEYGEDVPTISDESPANFATGVDPNPPLQATIYDLQGDAVDWQVQVDAGGSWQTIDSGTLPAGEGTVSATPTTMDAYDTTYQWQVTASDPLGSGETAVETYQFTTRPANYAPSVDNPDPPDGATHVPLNPTLAVDVADLDGDLLAISFETDATGTWTAIQTYTDVGDGRYTAATSHMDQYATAYNWRVTVDDGTVPVVNSYSLTTLSAPGTWWDRNWAYRKQITIDHTLVDEDLTDFPLLIDLTDADLAAYAQAGGQDIAFADNHGRKLSHEIETYNTGQLLAWVEVAGLSSAEDTILYLYFGNASAGDQQDVAGTWDNGYVMVHHLEEETGSHQDATAYHNDSTDVVVLDQAVVGQIDGADEFDGVDDYVRVAHDTSLQFGYGSFTAEAWIYPQSAPGTGGARIVNNRGTGAGGSYRGYHLKIKDDAGRWLLSDTGIDDATGNYIHYEGTTTYSYNQWYQVAMVYEADNQLLLYINGAQDGTLATGAYGSISNNLPTAIGAAIAANGLEGTHSQWFDGLLDEVKLSNVARSAGWLSTSYRNQHAPGAFCSLGSLELESGPPEISNPLPADGAHSVSISLSELTFDLHDPDGDPMDYQVTTAPDIGSDSVTGVGDGTYSLAVSGLAYDTAYNWTVTASDGTGTDQETFAFTTRRAPAPWWQADWAYRQEIVVDPAQVADDLTNFPLLIVIDDGSLAGLIQDYGEDIAFTDYGGAQLAHEIEQVDAASGDLVAWVNVPNLSSLVPTYLYLYYGNREVTSQQNPQAVWDSDYVLVQHLNESTGLHYDSTSYHNDGSPENLASQAATGQIDGADEFSGSPAQINVGTDPSLDVFGPGHDFGIFAWVKRDDLLNTDTLFSSGSGGANGIFFGTAYGNDTELRFLSPNNSVDVQSSASVLPDTAWHHVGLTADRNGNLEFWVDGVTVHSESIAAHETEDWNRLDDVYKIGTDRGEGNPVDGILDEVRVSSMVRSPHWILTSYRNQRDPAAFYTRSQEPASAYPPPTLSLVAPDHGASEEVPISFRFVPQTHAPGGAARAQAEVWLHVTETSPGEVVYTDNSHAPQRGVIKGGQLVMVEGRAGHCWITVRDFPGGTILRQGPAFGDGTHSNTSVVIDGDVIYGVCTNGVLQAWNQATQSVVWQVSVGPGGGYSTTSNSMEIHDGHLYIQSADFVIHKIQLSDGVEVDSLTLDNTGGLALKAHMLLDAANNRLYALGDSYYYAIDLTTFAPIWTLPIVAGGGRDTRGGPILVDDANSGQYLTIFTTFPQDYVYAVDYEGNVVWTWTEMPVRAHATYNPNTGLVYVVDATGYTDAGTGLTLPGTVYALDVSDGSQVWLSHGDGTDRFSRPITASGNYLIFKTDNPSSDDYLYVLDATDGHVLAKVPAGGNKGYWCFPPALSGGYVATGGGYSAQGGNVLDIYRIGDGSFVDYYPLHGNVHHTGYVADGLTSLGLTTTSWQLAKVNDVPLVDGVENTIDYDFDGHALPATMDWRIRLVQSDNQVAWSGTREVTAEAPWYHDDWAYRKAIVVDHWQVPEDLTDFPLLIDIVDEELGDKAQLDGDDVLFTTAAGSKLAHQLEFYQVSSPAHLVAWVHVPVLSSSNSTTLYMYYGNASASAQEDPTAVWDSHYVMVQHLDETTGLHLDSTTYGNDSSLVTVTDQGAAGQIDGADEFDGIDDHIRVPDAGSLQFGEGSFTAEAWIYPRSVPDSGGARIVNNRGTGAGGVYPGYQFKIDDLSGAWHFWDASIDDGAGTYHAYEGTTTYAYDEWYHVAMVYEADVQLRFYVNGVQDGVLSTGAYGSLSNALPTAIGGSIAHNGIVDADNRQFFDGLLDEVRLSNTARSAAWITTEYRNISAPGSFYAVGSEETSGPPTAVSLVSFTAEPGADHITLAWETATEIDTLGFHLYRSEAAKGRYIQLTDSLIPGQAPGSPVGGTYAWVDTAVEPGSVYFYQLETVDVRGHTERFGPVSVAVPGTRVWRLYLPMITK